MKLIAKALLEAQKKIENALKDSKNPHFKSNYASLESVLETVKGVANAHGIAIVQAGGKDEQGHFLETKLVHESGEEQVSRIYLVLEKQTMQGLGSALTYARRYALTAIFGIGQDDDDGNRATAETSVTHTKQQEPVTQLKQNTATNGTPRGFKPRGATQ